MEPGRLVTCFCEEETDVGRSLRSGLGHGHGVTQLVAGIAAVGEDVAQPGEAGADLGQDVGRAIAILDTGVWTRP